MTDSLRGLRLVSVAGPRRASDEELADAEDVGARLADAGFAIVTGGLGGVMEAASRGAKSRRGITVGVLPGTDAGEANGWVDLALPTGLGELRNGLVVRCADAVIAVGGEFGTLSEIALALKAGKLVVGVGTWQIDGVRAAPDACEAVALVLG